MRSEEKQAKACVSVSLLTSSSLCPLRTPFSWLAPLAAR